MGRGQTRQLHVYLAIILIGVDIIRFLCLTPSPRLANFSLSQQAFALLDPLLNFCHALINIAGQYAEMWAFAEKKRHRSFVARILTTESVSIASMRLSSTDTRAR